jgi:hypothetical protein
MAVYTTDGTQADVQAKINGAVGGDTVTIPSGSFTWTSGVTISGKYLKIQGAGSGRVVGRSTSSVSVGTGTKVWTTQSGLSISGGQTLRIYRSGGVLSNGWGTGIKIWCEGTVTTYSGATLTMNITSISATTGTYTSWDICSIGSTVLTNNAGSTDIITITENASGSTEVSDIQFMVSSNNSHMIKSRR